LKTCLKRSNFFCWSRNVKAAGLASIHTILKRLEDAGKVGSERNDIGKTAYRWISEEEKLETLLGPTSFVLGSGGGSVDSLPVGDPDKDVTLNSNTNRPVLTTLSGKRKAGNQ
jgi:hypothetical protein